MSGVIPLRDGRYVVWLEELGRCVGVQIAYFTSGVNKDPVCFEPLEVDTRITGVEITGHGRIIRGRWKKDPCVLARKPFCIPAGRIDLSILGT